MTPDEVRKVERYLSPKERAELYALIEADMASVPWRALPGPQSQAFDCEADIVGYGGAAGGGKTDLLAGLTLTKHKRCLIVRREKAQTEGVVQRLTEILGSTDGYNSQKGIWRLPQGSLLEVAGLDNEGDERRWQGRPHDLKAFDEATEMREHQVRFIMGWMRTNQPGLRSRVLLTFNPPTTSEGRWVIDFFGPWLDKKHPNPAKPGELRWFTTIKGKDIEVANGREFVLIDGAPCYEFDPDDYKPEDIVVPKSRTFIPARLTDNPYYMASGYMSTLQALPEPLRSQMLYGDFNAGVTDDPWQVIPTAWVEEAQARWKPRARKGEMLTQGVDVARGGKDNSVISNMHAPLTPDEGPWFDELEPRTFPGAETPNGPALAGLIIAHRRDLAPVLIDVIGVGAAPYDVLNGMDVQVHGVNMSAGVDYRDKSGMLSFLNTRSWLWWNMREALDPANGVGIALPPDKALLSELCMPKWSVSGKTIKVESREEIVKRLGRSPDRATAVILANMGMPKIGVLRAAGVRHEVLNYDPMANMR